MGDHLARAAKYRERAEQVMRKAESMKLKETRDTLLFVAANYLDMATCFELIARAQSPRNDQ
jgi:hypothetical protein